MAKQRYTTEEIIHKLREADVLIGQGQTVAQATKQIGVTDCVFRRKPGRSSGVCRARIPDDAGHRFRGMPAGV
jgi:hypothetical protein